MLASRFARTSLEQCRLLNVAAVQSMTTSTARHNSSAPKKEHKKPKDSKSFVLNLFRGRAVVEQACPYPLNLDEDRREMLQMILSPTQKFLEEVNDPAK